MIKCYAQQARPREKTYKKQGRTLLCVTFKMMQKEVRTVTPLDVTVRTDSKVSSN